MSSPLCPLNNLAVCSILATSCSPVMSWLSSTSSSFLSQGQKTMGWDSSWEQNCKNNAYTAVCFFLSFFSSFFSLCPITCADLHSTALMLLDPSNPISSHKQDLFCIMAPPPEVHRRRHQIAGGLPSKRDAVLLPRHFSVSAVQ